MALTVNSTGSISISDTVTNNLSVAKTITALLLSASTFVTAETVSIGTSPTSISLPISPVQTVYIRNTHATQTLTVTWTPNGGASNIVVTLQPNSWIMLSESNLTSGITALSLQASGANTTVEYILAG